MKLLKETIANSHRWPQFNAQYSML